MAKGQARSTPRPFLKVGDIVPGSQLISEFAFIGKLSDGVLGLTHGQLFISLLAKCCQTDAKEKCIFSFILGMPFVAYLGPKVSRDRLDMMYCHGVRRAHRFSTQRKSERFLNLWWRTARSIALFQGFLCE